MPHERGDTAGIREREAQPCRPAPIVTDESYPAQVELAQQRRQIRDVPVEAVRLLNGRKVIDAA
jgi:hypothetical protein